jgi:hypothetical protein
MVSSILGGPQTTAVLRNVAGLQSTVENQVGRNETNATATVSRMAAVHVPFRIVALH